MMTTGASQSPSILAYIRDEEEAGFIARIARKTRASRNRERGTLRILAQQSDRLASRRRPTPIVLRPALLIQRSWLKQNQDFIAIKHQA